MIDEIFNWLKIHAKMRINSIQYLHTGELPKMGKYIIECDLKIQTDHVTVHSQRSSGIMYTKYRRVFCYTTATGAFVSYLWWRSIGSLFTTLSAKDHSQYNKDTLDKNAVLRNLTHPTISSVHVNSLASNIMMEDRHTVHLCPQTGIALLSVIDGHGGWWCADHIKRRIATYVADHLKRAEINVAFSDILESSEKLPTYSGTPVKKDTVEELIMEQLKNSFVDLDNDISEAALDAVKQVGMGHSLTDVTQQDIVRALTGACVNTLLLHGRSAFVANTGDCRSVLGRKENNKWISVPLSTDHAYDNQNEVARITQEHPGEVNTLFSHRRLLGGLMPFRSFGDVTYKWKQEHLNIIYQQLLPGYYTPPYLTAKPEVSHRKLTEDDKFIVIATDGLWERLSNEQVITFVGDKLDRHDGDNIATALLKHALGRDDEKVYELLTLTPPESRWFRDDITIIIVTFK